MEDESLIDQSYIITHLINPSYFYLYDPKKRNEKTIKDVDEKIMQEISENVKFSYEPAIGDLVGIYLPSKEKYIRCEIDDIRMLNNKNHYFLFSLDYGKLASF